MKSILPDESIGSMPPVFNFAVDHYLFVAFDNDLAGPDACAHFLDLLRSWIALDERLGVLRANQLTFTFVAACLPSVFWIPYRRPKNFPAYNAVSFYVVNHCLVFRLKFATPASLRR